MEGVLETDKQLKNSLSVKTIGQKDILYLKPIVKNKTKQNRRLYNTMHGKGSWVHSILDTRDPGHSHR